MITFKGWVTQHYYGNTWYTTQIFYSHLNNHHDGSHFCGAICTCILTEEGYREREGQFVAWGYDGKRPDLLSVGILAVTMANCKSWLDMVQLFARQHDRDDDGEPIGPKKYSWVFRKDVLRYYRDFTKEVTSKWGDKWTITSNEVMAWLRSKGYQQNTIKKEEVMA